MSLKGLKLSVSSAKKPVDPLEVFNKLTLRGSIENIWEPQAEALKGWHKERSHADVVVQMNTGGGKTLVGLMIAQSLLNELNRRVLYVVPNNQLVEQTLKQATSIGLQPATRYKGEWRSQEGFEAAETFCITNYASVFTGRSTFRDKGIGALVFDDAHVAEGIIREQFTLPIAGGTDLYKDIVKLFRPHFANTLAQSTLADIERGSQKALLFVPMFLVWKHKQQLRELLLSGGAETDKSMLFAWDHIADHLSHCCVLIASSRIEISPPAIPLHTLPYFGANARRVYLTATLPSDAGFARTFGLDKPHVVRPGGKSGDAQRLIIFAPGSLDEAQRKAALSLVATRKACVISPSKAKIEQWSPPASVYDTNSGHEGIEKFKASTEPQLLGLMARYDGIDLPGDSCRVLIIDRLPKGESLFDRFVDEGMHVDAIRTSQTATRIVQAIGRIFRSNTDHGSVILVGADLHDWIRNPENRFLLPDLLQRQIALGMELSKKVAAKETNWTELLDAVLTGNNDWDDFYNEHVDQFPVKTNTQLNDWYPPLLLQEHRGYAALWDGNFSKAATCFQVLAVSAGVKDRRLAAWYKHLEGVALLHADEQQTSLHAFVEAYQQRKELGQPSERRDKMFKPSKPDVAGFQSIKLAARYRTKRTTMLAEIETVIRTLVYDPNKTAEAEEAMRVLGSLLGLDSSRPEKIPPRTGPDDLWCGESDVAAWGFDLKTGKQVGTEYSKEEIGTAHQHAQWVRDNNRDKSIRHSIVGRESPVSNQANPDHSLDIIDLCGFQELATNVKKLLESVDAGDKNNLEDSFESWLRHYGLLWPQCVLALPSKRAIDLKND